MTSTLSPDKRKSADFRLREIEKRAIFYIKNAIKWSADGICWKSNEEIRAYCKCGRDKLKDVLNKVVANGEFVRIEIENRNRINKKYVYALPDVRLDTGSMRAPNKDSYFSAENLKRWRSLTRLELIENYIDAGLCITPLIEKGKIPLSGWTQEKLRGLSKKELIDFFAANPNLNVGCWMPKELVAVDVDNVDEFYRVTHGEDFETLRVSNGGRGFHLWFKNNLEITNYNDRKKVMDFKAEGGLMVLPPSIHESGRRYEWVELVAPIDTPHALKKYFDDRQQRGEQIQDTRYKKVIRTNHASPRLSKTAVICKGERYPELFKVGRQLRLVLDADDVTRELHDYNQQCCRPMLDTRRMQKLIRDVLHGANRKDYTTKAKAKTVPQAREVLRFPELQKRISGGLFARPDTPLLVRHYGETAANELFNCDLISIDKAVEFAREFYGEQWKRARTDEERERIAGEGMEVFGILYPMQTIRRA
jgi:hypothetical protein